MCLEHGLITHEDSMAMRSQKESRRLEMIRALQRHGCVLRTDSKLCNDYIRKGRGDPEEIAIVMGQMKFLFEETNYAKIRKE